MITYIAINTLNGKFYIGSTKDFENRKKDHLKSKKNYPFQNALRKNSEVFEWVVQSDDCDEPVLEQALLDMWFGKECCYNLNPIAEHPPNATGKTWWKNELTQELKLCFEKPQGEGWEKGMFPPSEEFRKKISEATSGEKNPMYGRTGVLSPCYGRTGEKHPLFGVPRTEAWKQAQSENWSGENSYWFGKTGSLHPCSRAVTVTKPDGTELHFGSAREASRELEIAWTTFRNYMKISVALKKGKFKDWRFG